MWPELKRKAFHLTSLIYVVALVWMSRPAFCLLILALLIVALIGERLRLKVPAFGAFCERRFGGIMREDERTAASGIVWMLAGVLSAALLLKPTGPAAAAILYVVFGDAAASLIGKRFGGLKWPGSVKSLSGSIACFVVCVAIGKALLVPAYGWSGVWAGAAVATAVEFWTPGRYDNFLIPFLSSLALMACYGLSPL